MYLAKNKWLPPYRAAKPSLDHIEYHCKLAEIAVQYPEGYSVMNEEIVKHAIEPEELERVVLKAWEGKDFHGMPVDIILQAMGVKNKTVLAFSMTDFLLRLIFGAVTK